MSDWPPNPQPFPPLAVISTCSRHSIGGHNGAQNNPGTAGWPAANRALFVPFRISAPFLVRRIFWNQAGVAGNVDAGVYASDGAGGGVRLFSIGSTGASGSNALQGVNLGTPYRLDAGCWYFAMNASSTSEQMVGPNPPDLQIEQTWGLLEAALGSVTLPATVTFATVTTAARCPWIGISQIASLP